MAKVCSAVGMVWKEAEADVMPLGESRSILSVGRAVAGKLPRAQLSRGRLDSIS